MSKITELAKTKDYLRTNLKVLSIFGVWPLQHKESAMKDILYRSYSILFVGVCLHLSIVTEVIKFILVFGDIDKTAMASFLTLTHLVQAYKTYNLQRQKHQIEVMMDKLDDPLFSEVDPRSVPSVQSSIMKMKVIRNSACIVCVFYIIIWSIIPHLGSEEDKNLPLASWLPFDTNQPIIYELMYAYQVISTLINGWCNTCMDTFMSGNIGIACVQIDVLHDKIANFESSPSLTGGSRQYDREIQQHLKNCVQHHLKIIRYVEDIERLFGGVVFIQCGASTLIVCITLFKLSTSPDPLEMLSLMLYMSLMLAEILVFCYYGNELMLKSHLIMDAAYMTMWYGYSLANRKLIFLMMERSKQPLKVTAGIFTLSLDTFTSILRTSYSYFAVLRQVNADV